MNHCIRMIAILAIPLLLAYSCNPKRESKASKKPLYENAISNEEMRIKIGPNQIIIRSVVRNDRNGAIHYEDAAGRPYQKPLFPVNYEFVKQAKWLDLVNIYLNLEYTLYDIIELRVFDSETKQFLGEMPDRYWGYGANTPSVIQLYSCMNLFPSKIDLWLRVNSYNSNDPVYQLATDTGSSVRIQEGDLLLEQLLSGTRSYTLQGNRIRWEPQVVNSNTTCTAVFSFQGNWTEGKYQLAAVDRTYQKYFPSQPHFVDFNTMGRTQIIQFNVPMGDLSHFEIRPFGGRHRFYFEGIQLPRNDLLPLQLPPVIPIPIFGQETAYTSTELSPILVQVKALKGSRLIGVSSDGAQANAHVDTAAKDIDNNKTTIICQFRGLNSAHARFTYIDRAGNMIVHSKAERGNASGALETVIAEVVTIPLSEIHSIRIKLYQPEPNV